MFTPFTLSIYRGVLSPQRLEECGISPGQFLQAARQLELCHGTEGALCACIASLVPGYSHPSGSMTDALFSSSTLESSVLGSPGNSSSLGYYSSYYKDSHIRVRDYVKTLSFDEQYNFGINVLKQFGWKP